MATEILLTSETFVKSVSSISDNIAGKYLRPSIREAQDIQFRRVVGDALLAKLKTLVSENHINDPENEAYKNLLDRSQYVIAYYAIVELCQKVAYKVANAGVVKTSDENVQQADRVDLASVREYNQAKGDSAVLDLQEFILQNRASYPELSDADCNKIHATLYSAASCGIFLGGARGKVIRGYYPTIRK